MKWNVWHIEQQRWMSTHSWGRKYQALATLERLIEFEGYHESELELRKVLPMMEQHGTTLVKLKPAVIWQCAAEDLERRKHNRDVAGGASEMRPYAFDRKHVVKAESANDILRAAIADPDRGRSSTKRDTRLLYYDVELLKAALQ